MIVVAKNARNLFFAAIISSLFGVSAQAYDCATLRTQIAELPTSGGTIFIPAGTYDCDASIIINRSYVKLIGAGRDVVTLRLADHVHAPLLVIGDSRIIMDDNGNFITAQRVSNIEISELTLDGNRLNHDVTKECGENSCASDPIGIRNNGITIRGASEVYISNVISRSMISGGLVTEKYSRNIIVDHFEAYDNYFDGLAGYQTEASEFSNLSLHDNLGAGLSLDIDFNHNVIRDADLFHNRDVGIFGRHLDGNHFLRVSIQRSGNHGVFLARAETVNSCAINNIFEDVQINQSKFAGFRLNDNCPGNSIIGVSNLCGNATGGVSEQTAGGLLIGPQVQCR